MGRGCEGVVGRTEVATCRWLVSSFQRSLRGEEPWQANRVVAERDDVRGKVYSRDLFGGMRRGLGVRLGGRWSDNMFCVRKQ